MRSRLITVRPYSRAANVVGGVDVASGATFSDVVSSHPAVMIRMAPTTIRNVVLVNEVTRQIEFIGMIAVRRLILLAKNSNLNQMLATTRVQAAVHAAVNIEPTQLQKSNERFVRG